MHVSRTAIILVALMACVVIQPSNAQSKAVGKVAILKGSGSRYTPDGSAQALQRGDKVYEGDRVVTGRKSLLSILFDDKTRFNLGPNTVFRVTQVRTGEDGIFNTQVVRGAFRFVTGLIAKRRPRAMRVKTGGVATIGIRGTTVGGEVIGDSATIVLLEAKDASEPSAIEVANEHGSVVINKTGYGTRVPDANSAPTPPERMRLRAIENLIRNINTIQRSVVPRPRIR